MEPILALVSLAAVLFFGLSIFLAVEGRKRIKRLGDRVMAQHQKLAECRAERSVSENKIRGLREMVNDLRDARDSDAREYMNRVGGYEQVVAQRNNRIDELTRQNQNLVERLASLRQEGLTEGGDDFHVEDAAEEPWDPDLQDFYDNLSASAQSWAEEFIEVRRERGMEDEQILQELDQAGSVV